LIRVTALGQQTNEKFYNLILSIYPTDLRCFYIKFGKNILCLGVYSLHPKETVEVAELESACVQLGERNTLDRKYSSNTSLTGSVSNGCKTGSISAIEAI
jgi:hypothetical protein